MFIKKNHLKNYAYELFFTFHNDMNPHDTKRKVTIQQNRLI